MTISLRSRYNRDAVVRVAGRDGILRPTIVMAQPAEMSFNYTTYAWQDSDRVDALAQYFYGDETAWWLIADANPEILVWDEVPLGSLLRIPDA